MTLVVASNDGWAVALFKDNWILSQAEWRDNRYGLEDCRRKVNPGMNVEFFDVALGFGT